MEPETRNDIQKWRERLDDARADRRRKEPTWQQNAAFAGGKQWLEYIGRTERKLVLPKLPEGRERQTVDAISQYIWTAIGELMADEFLLELLFRKNDVVTEALADQINAAYSWGWDNEWNGERAVQQLLQQLVAGTGTAAIVNRFDPTRGEFLASVPHINGQPIFDPAEQRNVVAQAQAAGQTIEFKDVKRGRIEWDVLSGWNLLAPPGISDPEKFPWEATVSAMHIEEAQAIWPAARNIEVDTQMTGLDLLGAQEAGNFVNPEHPERQTRQMREHILVWHCYDRPCGKYPSGRVMVLGGAGQKLLAEPTMELPIKGPMGEYRSGINYFQYWTVPDQFWGRALVEAGLGIQRILNKRRTQVSEIIDRGLPKIFAEEDSLTKVPEGRPLELIYYQQGKSPPQSDGGISPGSWMYEDMNVLLGDMQRAMGIRDVSLGENPVGVKTYSQLALLHENDQTKVRPVISRIRESMARATENTLYQIRQYWGPDKQLMIAGEGHILQASTFNASRIPDFFQVRIPRGAGSPRSGAAELTKIDQLWNASLSIGQPLPITWLSESIEAGKALAIPKQVAIEQIEKAQWENILMIRGEQVPVAYYDPIQIHIEQHRQAQIQAELSKRMDIVALIEQHVQEHIRVQTLNELQAMQAQGAPVPEGQIAELEDQGATSPGAGPGGSSAPASAALINDQLSREPMPPADPLNPENLE
tara:strand:- start:24524 stop:26632 length:2109 start_codon:yes stop_codon:yes gene_type:complete